jgi:UDP:flavonoid glycosyltransferase YjiC (YdhE family)
MDEREERSFLDAAGEAFLRRRLHNRRMRAAAVRGLKLVSAGMHGLHMDFDEAAEIFSHMPPWMASYAGELDAALASGDPPPVPRMSIVIMVVGSRGDVQPFLPIGRRLAQRHRVRIATHHEFRSMVEEAELEFYPLGGDPHELINYMVKTGGRIIPTRVDQLVEDVPKKRAMIADILASTWRACTDADPEHPDAPFQADWIIANPPSYGHIHCAERLHIPLHMIFTMPWTPTSAFPHPMARLDPGVHRPVQNYMSYTVVDVLAWSGIGDLVNEFREQTLGLPPISLSDGASLLEDHEVPFTYLWPASLVPKPRDWGPHIDLANFIFYDLAHSYEPPRELQAFLDAGAPPIYVGFGSAIVEDAEAISRTIFAAVEKAGVRGVVSEGWSHLGGAAPPPNVHLIGDVPHDWLFPRCSAVCHHGGAGTTAAGLRAGLPTVVVPFFGDQFFWGEVIVGAGAGPDPIPIQDLDADNLAAAFARCAEAQVRDCAAALGAKVREVDGVELVIQSLGRHLPAAALRCAHDPEHLARRFCDDDGVQVCEPCSERHHGSHAISPYRYIDWGIRPARGLAQEIVDLVSDAAQALRAGLEELMPNRAPRRRGVVFGDTESPHDTESDGPVRKLKRWLGG